MSTISPNQVICGNCDEIMSQFIEQGMQFDLILTDPPYNINKDLKSNVDKASANINMSQTTEINPYLLLTAHSIIRHVIEIDNNATLGITSHSDNF